MRDRACSQGSTSCSRCPHHAVRSALKLPQQKTIALQGRFRAVVAAPPRSRKASSTLLDLRGLAHLIYFKINHVNRLKSNSKTTAKSDKWKHQNLAFWLTDFSWQERGRPKCPFQGCRAWEETQTLGLATLQICELIISPHTNRFLKGHARWKYSAGTLFQSQ